MSRSHLFVLGLATFCATGGAAEAQSSDDLRSLLSQQAQTAIELTNNEIERGAIEMQATQLILRGNSINGDSEVLGNEIGQFNGRCEREFTLPNEAAAYQGCQTWRSGISQRLEVLVQNGEALDRDIQALRQRDRVRVERGSQLLRSLAENLVRVELICARLPPDAREGQCRRPVFDPRIQALISNLTTLASRRSDECLGLPNPEPERMAECARAPFDLSNFDPSRPVPTVPEGFVVHRNN